MMKLCLLVLLMLGLNMYVKAQNSTNPTAASSGGSLLTGGDKAAIVICSVIPGIVFSAILIWFVVKKRSYSAEPNTIAMTNQ